MSRIGKLPIDVLKGVEVKIEDGVLHIKGPKGQLSQPLMDQITLRYEDDKIFVEVSSPADSKFQGLYRSLIANMVHGVTTGFEKKLELRGVGFRAAVSGNNLDLQLGFSHPVLLPIPEGLTVKVEKNTLVIVSGADKQLVGQFAALIRAKRKPEPYKGKGVRYLGEHVRKKAGKAGRAAKG